MDVIRHEHIAAHKNLRDFWRAPAEGDELFVYPIAGQQALPFMCADGHEEKRTRARSVCHAEPPEAMR